MKHEAPGQRHGIKIAVVILLAVLGGVFLLHSWDTEDKRPSDRTSRRTFSGPIEDGHNGLSVHGAYGTTMEFSPDAKHLAYVWQDASYVYTAQYEGRPIPLTLTEDLEIRVLSVHGTNEETRLALDSIDLRPKGFPHFYLGASLHFSPGSQYLAAICARRLVLLDMNAGTHRVVQYDGEFFGSFAWLSTNEIAFSTSDGKALTFWRYDVSAPTTGRMRIYTEPSPVVGREGLPPDLRDDQWSPNGRFAAFISFRNTRDGEDVLLDVKTQAIHAFSFSLYYQCWKPDSSALLVNDKFADGSPFYLIDPTTGESQDLTPAFAKEFGPKMNVTLVSRLWTPDEKYVVLYPNEDEGFFARDRGFVVQPVPFEVILSKNQILRRSPIPDWFLLQGLMTFEWIDISGQKTATIQGWVNDWTWSDDGRLAARIDDGHVKIFRPSLPPGVE